MSDWVVYILECKDKTLYTGITNNLAKRVTQHQQGLGAKYTKGRGPFKIQYTEHCKNKSLALRRECEIKKLSREQKIDLCSQLIVDA